MIANLLYTFCMEPVYSFAMYTGGGEGPGRSWKKARVFEFNSVIMQLHK